MKAALKIMVSTFQILGHLGILLNVQLPDIFGDFLEIFVSWFRFDISVIFNIGCLSSGGCVTGFFPSSRTFMTGTGDSLTYPDIIEIVIILSSRKLAVKN